MSHKSKYTVDHDDIKKWAGGRYGHGQVLLLEDHGLLIVVSEKGHTELGKFQSLTGKTWNIL